jgi:hypothetical protein
MRRSARAWAVVISSGPRNPRRHHGPRAVAHKTYPVQKLCPCTGLHRWRPWGLTSNVETVKKLFRENIPVNKTKTRLIRTMYTLRSQMREGVDHPRSHDDGACAMVFLQPRYLPVAAKPEIGSISPKQTVGDVVQFKKYTECGLESSRVRVRGLSEFLYPYKKVKIRANLSCKPLSGGSRVQIISQRPEYPAGFAVDIH